MGTKTEVVCLLILNAMPQQFSTRHAADRLLFPSTNISDCVDTDLSPDPLPTLPLFFFQVSYHYGTVYPGTLFWLPHTLHLSLKSN